jgi:hypothetical protein
MTTRFGRCGRYVNGRTKSSPEMNGKSANLNNALKNHIYRQDLWAPLS